MSFFLLCLILLTVTLSACAQLLLKLGVSQPIMAEAISAGLLKAFQVALTSPLIWAGMTIYVVGLGMWLWVLSKVDLSVAYPFVGISFLFTMAFGALILNESVTPMRLIGTVLIIGGCVLVGRSV
jgi:multidrug transporter EmrE-like cation transporter